MISIKRFMLGGGESRAGASDSADPAVLHRLCVNVLEHVGTYVFTNEFSSFRPPLREVKESLGPDMAEPDSALAGETVRAILSDYNKQSRETLQNTAIEMRQMVGVLGNALTVLSGGSERSVSRLQRIQETLQRASTIQDMAALRASLWDAVQLVKEESAKEQQASAREREGLETQVVRFRELLAGNPNRKLPGRAEAMRAISDSLSVVAPGKAVYVVAFVLEQLDAIVQRYGPEVVDDLFLQLIRERLQPLASGIMAFRWAPASLVGVAQTERDLGRMQAAMGNLNRAPLVYRIALGSRTAVLKVGLSHLVTEATEQGKDQWLAEIDRFSGFEAMAIP